MQILIGNMSRKIRLTALYSQTEGAVQPSPKASSSIKVLNGRQPVETVDHSCFGGESGSL